MIIVLDCLAICLTFRYPRRRRDRAWATQAKITAFHASPMPPAHHRQEQSPVRAFWNLRPRKAQTAVSSHSAAAAL
jgi:hypothetical protein